MIVFCYSTTNGIDETDSTTLNDELSAIGWQIPKHNVLIIAGDKNTQRGKYENNEFSLHKLLNINSHYLVYVSLRIFFFSPNMKFSKNGVKLWTSFYLNNA